MITIIFSGAYKKVRARENCFVVLHHPAKFALDFLIFTSNDSLPSRDLSLSKSDPNGDSFKTLLFKNRKDDLPLDNFVDDVSDKRTVCALLNLLLHDAGEML